jgi:hypothetical protein
MGYGGIAPPFLTSALDGGEWSASSLGRFTPKEIAVGIHWIRGRVGPRTGLDAVKKRKTLSLLGIEPLPSSPWPVALPTELSGLRRQQL